MITVPVDLGERSYDVLVGDVWVGSGQSNMQFAAVGRWRFFQREDRGSLR